MSNTIQYAACSFPMAVHLVIPYINERWHAAKKQSEKLKHECVTLTVLLVGIVTDMRNLQVSVAGFSRVQVWVGKSIPFKNPYI